MGVSHSQWWREGRERRSSDRHRPPEAGERARCCLMEWLPSRHGPRQAVWCCGSGTAGLGSASPVNGWRNGSVHLTAAAKPVGSQGLPANSPNRLAHREKQQ